MDDLAGEAFVRKLGRDLGRDGDHVAGFAIDGVAFALVAFDEYFIGEQLEVGG